MEDIFEHNKNSSQLFLVVFALVLSSAIFVLDINAPLGIAVGAMYCIIVLYSWLIGYKYAPIAMATLCTIAIVVGFQISDDSNSVGDSAILNRLISIIVIWVCAILVIIARTSLLKVENQVDQIKTVFTDAPDAVIVMSHEGKIVKWNPKASELFLWEELDVIGEDFFELLIPAHISDSVRANILSESFGESELIEVEGVRSNGVHFVLGITFGVTEVKNEAIFTLFARDITKRKKTEQRLGIAVNQLEKSQELAKIGSWKWDLETKKIYWSNQLFKIYGLKPEIEGIASRKKADIYIHPEDRQRVEGITIPCYENKTPFNIEYRIIVESGEERWVNESVDVEYNKKNEPTKMFGAVLDITERVNILSELKTSSAELAEKVGSLKEYETRSNGILEALLELTQFNLSKRIPIGRRGDELDAIALGINTLAEELEHGIEELKQKNNKIVEINAELNQTNNELQQQHEELEANNEELEEQAQKLKEQQDELEEVNKDIEEKGELILKKNHELQVKAEQLELSSKYKSEFLANMSHELRSPLNSMLILSNDLLENKDGNLTQDQEESAKIIYDGGKELLNLINDILDLSKIEAGKMDISSETVEIAHLRNDISNKFSRLARAKGIDFSFNVNPKTSTSIISDNQRVRQIISNLVSNAIKFTSKGEVNVNISEINDQIKIDVIDSGIGIPRDKQRLIFDAFTQADGGTTRKYGGTGLGLTITSHLTKLLGGNIVMESEEEKGSTFSVVLPKKLEVNQVLESVNKTKPITEFTESNSQTTDRKKNTSNIILVIEDDINFSKILQAQAIEMGFDCEVAHSGKEGLEKALKNTPKAIMLDIGLPDISGVEVARQLKLDSILSEVPIHVISARDKKDIKGISPIQYIAKPVDKNSLVEAFYKIKLFDSPDVKKLLLVEDNLTTRKAIAKVLSSNKTIIIEAGTVSDGINALNNHKIDCLILDLKLPDGSGTDIIKDLKRNGKKLPPVVVYTGKDLSENEVGEINTWASSIIVKGDESEKRLLDEATLFLHHAKTSKPHNKIQATNSLNNHDLIGKKVLLVDDDMRNVFALAKVLKNKNIEVIKASNGLMALEMLDKNPDVDIVLMDIMMPDMDGYETTSKIRKKDAFKDLPVIALTAKAMKDDRAKCLEAGASDYMSKPVDVDKLFNLMRVWIK